MKISFILKKQLCAETRFTYPLYSFSGFGVSLINVPIIIIIIIVIMIIMVLSDNFSVYNLF